MGPKPVTMVHLSDPHLPMIGGLSPRHWTLKRTLGYLNWQCRRKDVFMRAPLDRLITDLMKQAPEHIAVTGDLVNLGLPAELDAAERWLRALGTGQDVSVVPGNHDIYVRLRRDQGVERWRDYMCSDAFGREMMGDIACRLDGFPFVRKRGQVALIGLNSAVPTPPFVAAGELGEAQIAGLRMVLPRLQRLGLVRVVLIHHPPLARQTSRRRGLRDARALESVLRQYGADLVLHGHNHTNSLHWAEGPGGKIPILGIASAGTGSAKEGAGMLARYNLVRFWPEGENRRIIVTGRGLAVPEGEIVELDRREVPLKGELTRAVGLD